MEEETRSVKFSGEAVKKKIEGCSDVPAGSSSGSLEVSKVKKRDGLTGSGGSGSCDEQLEPKVSKPVLGPMSNGSEFSVDNDYDDGDDGDDDDDDDDDDDVRKTSNSRSRLGVFEFDEYDDAFDGKNSKGDILYKRKRSCFDKADSYMSKRVQGVNGVLNVTVNNCKASSSVGEERSKSKLRKSRPTKNIKAQDWISDDSDTPLKVFRNKPNSNKTPAAKISKAFDSDSDDDSDAPLKVTPKTREAHRHLESVRGKGEIAPRSKMLSPASEGKVKSGSGTEKQVLRDKIKKMLLDAGWTIDYRPRRNRNYQDAVYMSPSGSSYWSIIKAYNAFQKQAGEEDEDGDMKPSGECSSVSEIADLVINKLTRQTRKKIDKRRDANSAKYKRPKAIDKKGRAMKTDLVDSDTESQSEDNYTSDDNCNGKLGRGRKLSRCTLVARGTNTAKDSLAGDYIPYTGKRTLLSWLIDWGVVGLKEKVQYIKNHKERKVLLEGWITRGGIHCGCCSKILTVAIFEMHAGSKLRQPYQNIYLESGISLLQCQMDAWNKQEESDRSGFTSVHVDDEDPNDDTCGICGDGGDLICCDGCPSTFHQACLGMKILPADDWNCTNCTCKFCGMASITPDVTNRTGCDLSTCGLCERKYHKSCIQDVDDHPIDSTSLSFCGMKCREMFGNLQELVGVKHELEGGFSWLLVHRTDTADSNASVKYFRRNVECNSKVAVALTVMDECFLPIVDRRSGISIIHNVLYNFGSNFSRLNFCGFYTAILERGDEIISAASLRFHGSELAEMPFIGTRHIYRRQGMCNRLYRAIESTLCSLTVEKLIIPAISELMHTWTETFGFDYFEEARKEELMSINMLVFPGIDLLQKILKIDENNHPNGKDIAAAKTTINVDKASPMDEDKLNDTDGDTLAEHNSIAASDSVDSEDTVNDVPVPTTSYESHEVKVCVSNDELNSTPQPKDKVSESETEPKSIFSSSGGEEDVEMKDNIQQDALVTGGVEVNVKPSEDVSTCKGDTDLLVRADAILPVDEQP